eukprot:728461-Alexandrium_andersonii.AAC.1
MRKHTSAVAARVDGERHPCCLSYLHTARRCVQHLSCGSSKCKRAVIERMQVIAGATPYKPKLARKKQAT